MSEYWSDWSAMRYDSKTLSWKDIAWEVQGKDEHEL